MIHIRKIRKYEPEVLKAFRTHAFDDGSFPSYGDLCGQVKSDVLSHLVKDQGYLCAYCMRRIPEQDGLVRATIEHIIPQSINPAKALCYENMLAVCSGNRSATNNADKSCDASRGNKQLTVNPCDPATLTGIAYSNSGKISSTSFQVDADLNDTLHLNSARDLPNLRRHALDSLFKSIARSHRGGDKIYYQQLLDKFKVGEKEKTPYVGILIWWLEKKLLQF